jgi:predicted DNA-binding ribbon-helix-helix protein
MKSSIIHRSIVIAGRKTSVSLERAFWDGLHEIAKQRNESLSSLVSKINADRQMSNLSSAIRVFVLDYYRNLARGAQPKEAAPTSEAGKPKVGA